ncbi:MULTISPECIES: hypothetical protein [Bradyrhizobium]|nr:hypothetical protein [Bradyrhizobium canariense]
MGSAFTGVIDMATRAKADMANVFMAFLVFVDLGQQMPVPGQMLPQLA